LKVGVLSILFVQLCFGFCKTFIDYETSTTQWYPQYFTVYMLAKRNNRKRL